MSNVIDSFSGKYHFLSNFFLCFVPYEGLVYHSSENAFQAAKTLQLGAREVFALQAVTPNLSKQLGRALVLRPSWEIVKLAVMHDILTAKFSERDLRKLLIETGDAQLVEGNTWGDTYWGVCDGKGSNFLGKTLMDVRNRLTAKP